MIASRFKFLLLFLLSACAFIQGALAADGVTFAPFNSGTINGGGAVISQTLSTASLPASEYVMVNITADFVPAGGAGGAFSNSIQLELSDGGSAIYRPYALADQGTLGSSTATSLRWFGFLPRIYVGGTPLVVRIKDVFSGAFSSQLNNVTVSLYPTATPKYSFAAFNTGTITSATAGFTQNLTVSGMPATEYMLVDVTGSYVTGSPKSAFSNSMQMSLTNGGATTYWPISVATSGGVNGTTPVTLRWTGLMPRTYTGGGALSVKFVDPFTDANGPYQSSISNVVVSLHPVPTPKKVFATFQPGTITSNTTGFTQVLDTTGMSGEYVAMRVSADFSPTGTKNAFSSTMKMEVTNGGATTYYPATVALLGGANATGATNLIWSTMLPKSYVASGALNVRFFDSYHDASGPYTSSVNNVSVTFYPVVNAPAALSSLNRVDAALTNAGTVNWTATFSPAVTGLTASNFSLTSGVTGASIGTPTTANSGLTWNIPVTTGTGDGTLVLNLANATGLSRPISNTLPFAGQSYTLDKTAPTIVIGGPSIGLTKGGPVTYLVTYADANFASSTLASGNITLNKTGTNCDSPAVTGSGLTRTVTLSNITGDGSLGISIAAGTATDSAGNSAPAAGPSTTVTVDNTAPSIASATTASGTYNTAFSYTIVASTAVSFNATGLPSGLTFSGATISGTPTQPGTFTIPLTATDQAGNVGSGSLSLTIAKANATVVLNNLTQTYNGSIRPITATTTPAGLTVNFTYAGLGTAPTNAGSYAVVGTISDTNYQGSASDTLVVGKATAPVVLANLTQTYNGSPRPITATTTPAGLTVNFTYAGLGTAPTNAGSYAVVGTISDTNYQGSASDTLVVGKATAPVVLANLTQTYNGSPRPITATTTPAGLTVNFTYAGLGTAPTNAGSYAVVGTISDTNYQGSASDTLVVGKATAPVVLANLTQTYNGSPRPITATTTPAGLTVNFTYAGLGTAPTNAGSYAVVGTISDTNYQGSASDTLVVGKATAPVVLNNLTQTYNSSPRPITATTTPAGLTVNFTYAGLGTAPTNAGSYAVVGTISDTNYQGSASDTLSVGKVQLTVTADAQSRAFGFANPTLTATISGLVGTDTSTAVSGTAALSTTANAASLPAGYPITAAIGTLAASNYTFAFVNGTLTVRLATIADWKTLHFTAGELGDPLISGDSADPDTDGISTLLEFAFGTDPRNGASGPGALVYAGALTGGGSLTSPGQPITRFEAVGNGVDFRVIFLRRNPATTGGISYTPEFSGNLGSWQPSLAIPTVLATAGEMQVVSVPYPLFVAGKKARFFQLRVASL